MTNTVLTPIKAIAPDTVAWMAGLLEGEGYFYCIRNKLGIRLVMTDEDIVDRFAKIWDVKCYPLSKREEHHKQPFSATLTANKAAQCMKLIFSYMGIRRAERIQMALQEHAQHKIALSEKRRLAKYTFSDEELITAWKNRTTPLSFRKFCSQFGNCNRESTYRRLIRLGLIEDSTASIKTDTPKLVKLDINLRTPNLQQAWLAGLLEGEGSFSTVGAGGVRIGLEMTDDDVIAQAGSLMCSIYRKVSARNARYKPTYVTVVYGNRAATVMQQSLPWMGERRAAKIRDCLAARTSAQARIAAENTAFAISRETNLPAAELIVRWTSRVAGENLSSFAREYDVHPQIMKNRLVELGIYASTGLLPATHTAYLCIRCSAPFLRKASTRSGQYCSRVCCGRSAGEKRRKSLNGSLKNVAQDLSDVLVPHVSEY